MLKLYRFQSTHILNVDALYLFASVTVSGDTIMWMQIAVSLYGMLTFSIFYWFTPQIAAVTVLHTDPPLSLTITEDCVLPILEVHVHYFKHISDFHFHKWLFKTCT